MPSQYSESKIAHLMKTGFFFILSNKNHASNMNKSILKGENSLKSTLCFDSSGVIIHEACFSSRRRNVPEMGLWVLHQTGRQENFALWSRHVDAVSSYSESESLEAIHFLPVHRMSEISLCTSRSVTSVKTSCFARLVSSSWNHVIWKLRWENSYDILTAESRGQKKGESQLIQSRNFCNR